ncbi:hypothetical protein HUJ04_009639 [Dendroctonus ponderosae]|uniref:Anaphase-promoting complex subunit 10 n=1 Tax=Dendroctonus ponderosae TaxID=77166 RepID=A0AAR5QJ03_DENPD|nr:hypothetical protein HUJ04_009639 [Dendroctonus ponderosae]
MSLRTTKEVDPIKNERNGSVREVGCQNLNIQPISVTSFGVDQLRDDRADTYWQSDGQLPHLVNIQFQRKTTISDIYIYTDYKLDESYTPSRIQLAVTSNHQNGRDTHMRQIKIHSPMPFCKYSVFLL